MPSCEISIFLKTHFKKTVTERWMKTRKIKK
jgi:hypothetical protein